MQTQIISLEYYTRLFDDIGGLVLHDPRCWHIQHSRLSIWLWRICFLLHNTSMMMTKKTIVVVDHIYHWFLIAFFLCIYMFWKWPDNDLKYYIQIEQPWEYLFSNWESCHEVLLLVYEILIAFIHDMQIFGITQVGYFYWGGERIIYIYIYKLHQQHILQSSLQQLQMTAFYKVLSIHQSLHFVDRSFSMVLFTS